MAGTEVATRTPMQETLAQLRGGQFKEEIATALPVNLSPERFVRVAVTAIQQSPDLITCERGSLFRAIVRCAQDGLFPDGREAALVKFGNEAAYLPMIGGLRRIAADCGFSLEAYVVYENDEFSWQLGFNPTVTHQPPPLAENRGEPVGAYSVATDRATGQKFLEVMSRAEIEAVRAMSKAANGPAWTKSWGEMSRKTVARRNFKQLPLGGLNETQERILRQADADADLSEATGLTQDEANIAAPLSNVTPPADDGPNDDIEEGEILHEHEEPQEPLSDEQRNRLLELVMELTEKRPDTNWSAALTEKVAEEYGLEKYGDLTEPQAAEILDYLEGEVKKPKRKGSS